MMATSRPNMNITNPIKELVSKRRNRYRQDGYNLDLTYITPKIIAMGFPASNFEGCYRNHIDDVARMLDQYHKDRYRIYNLCSERSYDPHKFHNRVKEFPFDDHNPPQLELIQPFCEDVHVWLQAHEANVAVVHCKAGKGRTGTMICCYLLHSNCFSDAHDALQHYGQTRTQDKKGVTIPSQVRYVEYYARIVRDKLVYRPAALYLSEIRLEPAPAPLFGHKPMELVCTVHNACRDTKAAAAAERTAAIQFKVDVPVTGDCKVELHSKSKMTKKARLLQFWFNTFFVPEAAPTASSSDFCERTAPPPPPSDSGTGSWTSQAHDANGFFNHCAPPPCPTLCFKKSELDIINKKDKQHKVFAEDFKITLSFQRRSASEDRGAGAEWSAHHQQEQRSSASSDASDSDSSAWDSVVECDVSTDPSGVGYTRLLSDEGAGSTTKLSDHLRPELLAV